MRTLLQGLKNSRFLSNMSWILGGQIIQMLISFVVGVLTVRYLGPSKYGTLNYVNSYIAFFTTLIGLGLNGVIISEFVNHRDEEGKILGTAIVMRLIVSLISVVAFLILLWFTDGSDQTIMTVAVLQSIQLPFMAFDTINYWYQSKLLSKYSVIVQTITFISVSLYKVYLLVTNKGIAWFSFASSLSVILLAVMYLWVFFKHKDQPLKVSKTVANRILKNCFPFILANIMVVIYGQIDRVMIKFMLDSTTQVGFYSAALSICGIIGFIPGAILDSGRPLIVEAKGKSESLYQLRTRQLFAGILWACLIYSIIITAFSRIVILLLYGNEYLAATTCLRIAVWYTAFSYLGSARSIWLICENKNRYVFIFSVMGAITNVLLNYAMIPLWGINGAAFATLITQLFTNLVYPTFFKDTRPYSRCASDAMLLKNIKLKETIQMFRTQKISKRN